MPILELSHFNTGLSDTIQQFNFSGVDEIRIGGVCDGNQICLDKNPDDNIADHHAVIFRSAMNRLLLVVDLAGHNIFVNQHPVVKIRVLRHGDVLRIGQYRLLIKEVQVFSLPEEHAVIGQRCPVSRQIFDGGDEVIACPGCGAFHLREAWFLIEHCALGCGYPNRTIALETLKPHLRVQVDLDQESDLVERLQNGKVIQDGVHCHAGNRRDQIPFQVGDNVVFCPTCQTAYHLECFLTLDSCSVCEHDLHQLVTGIFDQRIGLYE